MVFIKNLLATLFFALISISSLYASEISWQLKSTSDGISIYTRKVEGSKILEFKATTVINASINKIIPIFEDVPNLSSWYYQCTHSKLVKDEGAQDKIIYIVLHLPWPVAQRDSVFKRSKSVDGENINYTIEALPDFLPVKKGKIRVLMINSHWNFKSLPDGKTEIYFQQHSNPGGSIPPFLVNAMAIDTPQNSLKALRDLVK